VRVGVVEIQELAAGTGREAARGDTVAVRYTGWLADGKRFDSSAGGEPFEFQLGAREVIAGWEQGIAGMRVGGKRRLVVPPELGYGSRGFPGVIPPQATLVFEVELVALR
jgi:FKBP-type peptidyl-prolyl cis-trans isomerase FkpA